MDSTAFPWLKSLPGEEVSEFLRELCDTVSTVPRNAASLAAVDSVIAAWRATAEVRADPALLEALLTSHAAGDFGEAPLPSGDVQVVPCEPTARVVRVLLPRRSGVVEIEPDLVDSDTGNPVIRVDVISDAERYGAADDGLFYEVVNRLPEPGVVVLIGREAPNE